MIGQFVVDHLREKWNSLKPCAIAEGRSDGQ